MKSVERWYSERVHQPTTLVRWGYYGRPVLLFPTAGGDAEEAERFGVIHALSGLLAAGRIKVYSIDSLAGRAWVESRDGLHCSWLQTAVDAYIAHEVVPAIRADCHGSDLPVVTAGASLGAFAAVSTLCRHPDAFGAALGLSGTYDLESWLHGAPLTEDFYFSSPLHFVPNLHGPSLELLRRRFVLLAFGQGRWETPAESWRLAGVLGNKGIPNRVVAWDSSWDHDWPTWRRMLPQYLAELSG